MVRFLSINVPIVEIAKRANRSHRIRHRSSGDKAVGCGVQANRGLTSCGDAPQSVQMSLGSPNTLCLYSCNRWQCPDRSCERMHRCLRFSLCSSSDMGGGDECTLLVP